MALELTDITNEIYSASNRLKKAANELFSLAKDKAEAERDYRKALAIEIMVLRNKGMSVTLISDLSRGNMADEKFKRDLADARYNAGRSSVEAIQSQIMALQSILKVQKEV